VSVGVLDWTLDLLFFKDLVQFMVLRAPTISQEVHAAQSLSPAAAALGLVQHPA
jgi:hypothetical protein